MEFLTGLLLVITAVIGVWYLYPSKTRKLRKIAGPSAYPLVGNAFQMDAKKPHDTLVKWAKQYGEVMRINLFGEDIVIANSCTAITEMYIKKSNDFAGRPPNYRKQFLFEDADILFSDLSPKWSFMKKASMTGLKQVGDNVTQLEDLLQGFLDDLTQKFVQAEGKPMNVRTHLTTFVNHVTFTLVYGRALSSEECEKCMKRNQELGEVFNPTSEFASLETLPFVRGFWNKNYRDFKRITREAREFFSKQVKITLDQYEDETRCVLDGMIKEMKDPSIDKFSKITPGNIDSAGIDLTTAGVMTTTSAMYYLIALMAVDPGMQEEAHQHIVAAIGERHPTLNDRFLIPYVESMVLELMRLMSHVPVSVPHKTLKDTSLGGYEVPEGTQVWPNLWYIHHDEEIWQDPWNFKPKRFLDDEGNLVKADHHLRKHFFAFGAGRRVCVGESLAKHRMFLFIASVIQKFKFVAPKGEKIITDPREFELAFVLRPIDYKVIVEVRQ